MHMETDVLSGLRLMIHFVKRLNSNILITISTFKIAYKCGLENRLLFHVQFVLLSKITIYLYDSNIYVLFTILSIAASHRYKSLDYEINKIEKNREKEYHPEVHQSPSYNIKLLIPTGLDYVETV